MAKKKSYPDAGARGTPNVASPLPVGYTNTPESLELLRRRSRLVVGCFIQLSSVWTADEQLGKRSVLH